MTRIPMSAHERNFFEKAVAKARLRALLHMKFGPDGRLPGVTTEEYQWMLRVCQEKPEWALPTLREAGFDC